MNTTAGIMLAAAAILLMLSVFFYLRIRENEKKLQQLRTDAKEKERRLKDREDRLENENKRLQERIDILWKGMNRIHLYASLTEEESGSSSVKEKQELIKRTGEELMEQLETLRE